MTIVVGRTLAVLAVLALTEQPPALTPLTAGLVIDRSVTIRPGTYRLSASADLARPAITIRGENITVGEWKLASVRGATVSPSAGLVYRDIVVTPTTTSPVDFVVTLEYRGAEVISPRGARTPAGKPYTFSYSRFFVPIDWALKFFEYGDETDPVKQPAAFAKVIAGTPLKTATANRLDYISGRAIEDGVPRYRFALVAEGTTTLPHGDYTLQVISDDGVRVWMDGAMILDEWAPHESKVNRVSIRGGGERRFKVEYYDVTGFAELRFDIQRK